MYRTPKPPNTTPTAPQKIPCILLQMMNTREILEMGNPRRYSQGMRYVIKYRPDPAGPVLPSSAPSERGEKEVVGGGKAELERAVQNILESIPDEAVRTKIQKQMQWWNKMRQSISKDEIDRWNQMLESVRDGTTFRLTEFMDKAQEAVSAATENCLPLECVKTRPDESLAENAPVTHSGYLAHENPFEGLELSQSNEHRSQSDNLRPAAEEVPAEPSQEDAGCLPEGGLGGEREKTQPEGDVPQNAPESRSEESAETSLPQNPVREAAGSPSEEDQDGEREKPHPDAETAQNGSEGSIGDPAPAQPREDSDTVIPEGKSPIQKTQRENSKFYEKMLCAMDEVPKESRRLLLFLARRIAKSSFDASVHPGKWQDEILRECGWTDRVALYRNLKTLCECGAIEKKCHGGYQIGVRYVGLIRDIQAVEKGEISSLEGFIPNIPKAIQTPAPLIPYRWSKLFSVLCRRANDLQEVFVGGAARYAIVSECGWGSKSSLAHGLRALCDSGVIEMMEYGNYRILRPELANTQDISSIAVSEKSKASEDQSSTGSSEENELTHEEISSVSPIHPTKSDQTSDSFIPEKDTPIKKDSKDRLIPNCWSKLFSVLCRKANDLQEVFTGGAARYAIAGECGWGTQSSELTKGLQDLCDCGVIKKLERNNYQILRPELAPAQKDCFTAAPEREEVPSIQDSPSEETGSMSEKTANAFEVPVPSPGSAPASEEVVPEVAGSPMGENTGEQVGEVVPDRVRTLFVVLCQMSENGKVFTGGSAADEMLSHCGWKNRSSLTNGLIDLCECGALKKVKRGQYQINPDFRVRQTAPNKDAGPSAPISAHQPFRDGIPQPEKNARTLNLGRVRTNESKPMSQEAAFKQSVLQALRKYREENGLGCFQKLSKNAGISVDIIRSMMDSGKVAYSAWVKVGKALGVSEG